MSSEAWSALRKEMYSKFSSGAEVILLDMGKSYGSKLVVSLSEALTEEDKLSYGSSASRLDPRDFSRMVTMTGWGRVTISGDLETGSHISVSVANCVFCEGEDDVVLGCPFLKGVSLGIATSLYKAPFYIFSSCVNEQSRKHVCKFELSRK